MNPTVVSSSPYFHYICVLFITFSNLTSLLFASNQLNNSELQVLPEAVLKVADLTRTDQIKQLLEESTETSDPVGFLDAAYKALETSSEKRATAIDDEYPSFTNLGLLLPSTSLDKNKDNIVETDISNVISSNVISSTTKSPLKTMKSDEKIIIDRKRFEDLAEEMKRNSDELVHLIRINAAFVVKDFIRVTEGLELQIREKSDALLQTVHQSADQLASDNVKLADAIGTVYQEEEAKSKTTHGGA